MSDATGWGRVKAHAALRNRIAQSIVTGIYRSDDDDTDAQVWLTVADAIIQELGLLPEWGSLDDDFGGILYDDRAEVTTGHNEKVYYRYITGWVAE